METPVPPQPEGDDENLVRDLVDEVQRGLDAADGDDDETRLETLEKTRRDLEAELDSSIENGSTRH